MLVSDLAIAAILAKAAAETAAWTARINLPHIDSVDQRNELEANINTFMTTCGTIARTIDEACRVV